ncbi:uncharacterized protein LOC141854864 [Brevipalpus obovatus]|uniref:uncharacterized protein LOC141854864 n=1 Tax=Brevipalpus obovatus TaxID=246614 RepID=UPI003D9F9078
MSRWLQGEVKDYTLIELPVKIPVQPICLAKDEVFDKNKEKAYKIFFIQKFKDFGKSMDAPMQTKAINPAEIEFQTDLHRIKSSDSSTYNFFATEPLVTVNENDRWSLRGLRLLSREWNMRFDIHHNIAADREILTKYSQEFCFV